MPELSISEIVELAAIDSDFFCHTFFPQTARQKSPQFHTKLWQLAESKHRAINIQMFRGSGKTSTLRMYSAKRVCYGLSRAILLLGKSEGSSLRSLNWLKNQVMTNQRWKRTFGLVKGSKWQDTEAEIVCTFTGVSIWIIAMGISGSVRGTLPEDFRPDLILLDDVLDDENSATAEQRQKIKERIYGAVANTLAPESECPDAKLVMLQTPLNKEDASVEALVDKGWASMVFPCWTAETVNKPLQEQISAWPERWSNEVLRRDKRLHIARNQSAVWYREMECRLISPETAAFRSSWLKFYEHLPVDGARVLIIDPVPPPSDQQIQQGMHKKDFEAITVLQRTGNDYYIVEYETNRGHDPSWTIATMFTLAHRWSVRKVIVEAVAYQRTLAWLIRKAMEQQARWYVVEEFQDQRAKFTRIVDGISGIASSGHLKVRSTHTDFISQFNDYPHVSHDDIIETVAIGLAELRNPQYGHNYYESGGIGEEDDESMYPTLRNFLGAP